MQAVIRMPTLMGSMLSPLSNPNTTASMDAFSPAGVFRVEAGTCQADGEPAVDPAWPPAFVGTSVGATICVDARALVTETE